MPQPPDDFLDGLPLENEEEQDEFEDTEEELEEPAAEEVVEEEVAEEPEAEEVEEAPAEEPTAATEEAPPAETELKEVNGDVYAEKPLEPMSQAARTARALERKKVRHTR